MLATADSQGVSYAHGHTISSDIFVFHPPSVQFLNFPLSQYFLPYLRVIPNNDLRNLISDASILLLSSSLSIHVSLPYCKADFETTLCILNLISGLMLFPKYLLIHPFNLLYLCTFYSRSIFNLCIDIQHPKCLSEFTCSMISPSITIFALLICFPSIAIALVLFLDILKSYFFRTRIKFIMLLCRLSSVSAKSTWSSANKIVFMYLLFPKCKPLAFITFHYSNTYSYTSQTTMGKVHIPVLSPDLL